jgi:hypothetical protein
MTLTPREAWMEFKRIIDTPIRELFPAMIKNFNWTNTKRFFKILGGAYVARYFERGTVYPIFHFIFAYSTVMYLGIRKKMKGNNNSQHISNYCI